MHSVVNLVSEHVGATSFGLVLPTTAPKVEKVLTLLHGLNDDRTVWYRNTNLQSVADEYSAALVLPEGERSFWQDLPTGGPGASERLGYGSFIREELPMILKGRGDLPTNAQQWAIAGNSMGGYGAMTAAYAAPETYGWKGAFSPVCYPPEDVELIPDSYLLPGEVDYVRKVGEGWPDRNVLGELFEADFPLHVWCGTADFLVPSVSELQKITDSADRRQTFHWDEGEGHGWNYWEGALNRFMEIWATEGRHIPIGD